MLQLQSHLFDKAHMLSSAIPIPDSVTCASLEERTFDIAPGKLWRRKIIQGSRFLIECVMYWVYPTKVALPPRGCPSFYFVRPLSIH